MKEEKKYGWQRGPGSGGNEKNEKDMEATLSKTSINQGDLPSWQHNW